LALKTLTEKHVRAVELILKGETNTSIGKKIGVSRNSVAAWKDDELFKAELSKQRQALKSKADERLLMNLDPLLDRLVDIALTSDSDKTSLDAIIYAINRVLGTPTNKAQDVPEEDGKKPIIDIDKMLIQINEKSGNN